MEELRKRSSGRESWRTTNKESLSGLPETLIQVDKMGLAGNSGKQSYGDVKVGHKGETSGDV